MKARIVKINCRGENEPNEYWLDMPVNDDVLYEVIGSGFKRSDYICTDVTEPLSNEDFLSLDELERLYSLYSEIKDTELADFVYPVSCIFFNGNSLKMLEHLSEFEFYPFDDMAELAKYLVEEKSVYGVLSDKLFKCIDYFSLGKSLYERGEYYVSPWGGILKCCS